MPDKIYEGLMFIVMGAVGIALLGIIGKSGVSIWKARGRLSTEGLPAPEAREIRIVLCLRLAALLGGVITAVIFLMPVIYTSGFPVMVANDLGPPTLRAQEKDINFLPLLLCLPIGAILSLPCFLAIKNGRRFLAALRTLRAGGLDEAAKAKARKSVLISISLVGAGLFLLLSLSTGLVGAGY